MYNVEQFVRLITLQGENDQRHQLYPLKHALFATFSDFVILHYMGSIHSELHGHWAGGNSSNLDLNRVASHYFVLCRFV